MADSPCQGSPGHSHAHGHSFTAEEVRKCVLARDLTFRSNKKFSRPSSGMSSKTDRFVLANSSALATPSPQAYEPPATIGLASKKNSAPGFKSRTPRLPGGDELSPPREATGPGAYDVPSTFSSPSNARPQAWARNRSDRFQSPIPTTPEPGAYDVPSSLDASRKKAPMSAFSSKSDRFP
eukprot:289029_1